MNQNPILPQRVRLPGAGLHGLHPIRASAVPAVPGIATPRLANAPVAFCSDRPGRRIGSRRILPGGGRGDAAVDARVGNTSVQSFGPRFHSAGAGTPQNPGHGDRFPACRRFAVRSGSERSSRPTRTEIQERFVVPSIRRLQVESGRRTAERDEATALPTSVGRG